MNNDSRTLFRIAATMALALTAIAGGRSGCLAAPDITLYDVDFNNPPHFVGMTPAFGGGPFPRDTPTSGGQIFAPTGTVQVVPAFGLLGDRPAQLTALDGTPDDPILGGADLHFDLSSPQFAAFDRIIAQVDVLIGEISTSAGFGIFFDAPAIHKIEFSKDGNIRVIDATGVDKIVGVQVAETVYTVRMAFDLAAAEWGASINGNPVHAGPVDDIDLETFRIAMTTGNTNTTSVALVDNIKITTTVPEPATLALAGLALFGVMNSAARRLRRHRE